MRGAGFVGRVEMYRQVLGPVYPLRGGSEVSNLHTEVMKFALSMAAAKNLAGVAENCW